MPTLNAAIKKRRDIVVGCVVTEGGVVAAVQRWAKNSTG